MVPDDLRNEILRIARAVPSGFGGCGIDSIKARDTDVLVELSGGDILELARAIADNLDHPAINFRSSEYGEMDDAIEDYGCDSCGHGAIIVLKGILA